MLELKHKLLTNKYTRVFHEEEIVFHAPHHFKVFADKSKFLEQVCKVDFQKGAIQEHGVNGVMNEDLIAMVICRLEHFNQSKFNCEENLMAIENLSSALSWLRKRTTDREQRGVEGTHIK